MYMSKITVHKKSYENENEKKKIDSWEEEKEMLKKVVEQKGYIEYKNENIKSNKNNIFMFLFYKNGYTIYLLYDRKTNEYIFSFPIIAMSCNYSKYFPYRKDGSNDLSEKKIKKYISLICNYLDDTL